jgi:hypothetical protein
MFVVQRIEEFVAFDPTLQSKIWNAPGDSLRWTGGETMDTRTQCGHETIKMARRSPEPLSTLWQSRLLAPRIILNRF